jgi:CPA1 family monovalent cation:H+ antiporter
LISLELFATLFFVIILIASLISIRLRFPYSIVLLAIGVLVAIMSNSYLMGQGVLESAMAQVKAYGLSLIGGQNGNLLVGLVVPPLIFEALTHVKSTDLKYVLRPATILATVGVVIATVVGGLLLWKLAGLPLYVSFLIAAIISPTDTTSVLELFRRLNIPSKLSALMETEAAFNDATGIIVFTIILGSIASSSLPVLTAGLNFILLFGGGIAVGLVVALVGELVTSVVSDRLTETILTITVVYGSYVLATALGFSGLIAVSIVALYFGNFTIKTAIRPSNRDSIRIFWEFAAFAGNSIAFLYIGLRTDLLVLWQSLGLIILAYAAAVAARVATVYPILTVMDKLAKTADRKIPLKWRNVAFLGGMRGALSIALASSVAVSVLISSTDVGIISNLVLGVAFLSIVLQSAFLSRYTTKAFEQDQLVVVEELNVKLARSISAIDNLQTLRNEQRISESEFLERLETCRDELEDVLSDMDKRSRPAKILKTRTRDLYSSISDSLSKARQSRDESEVSGTQTKGKDELAGDSVEHEKEKQD